MAAPLREQFKNNAVNSLDGDIDASQTTLDVLDATGFPATGNFRIVVGSEIMLCTGVASETLTVVRGLEGTSAASHLSGAAVGHILTAGGLQQWGRDNFPLWDYAGRLPLTLVDDDGVTPLAASDFTWVNQGGASATDQAGTIVMRVPTQSGENVRGLTFAAPSTPYAYAAAFQVVLPLGEAGDIPQAGFGFRQDSTGKMTLVSAHASNSGGSQLAIYNFNDPTTYAGSDPLAPRPINWTGNLIWVKLEDDGTDLKFYLGDGAEWVLIRTYARTTHMLGGPDELVWGGNNTNNGDCEMLVRLVHWSRVA
jgi:hypothetical protein